MKMTINLLKLQQESGFYGRCFVCGELISPERLVRGGDTCKPECQTFKRKSQRRFQRLVQLARLTASPMVRKLVRERERSALEVSESVNATV